jgi:pilus assembly protein CpaC
MLMWSPHDTGRNRSRHAALIAAACIVGLSPGISAAQDDVPLVAQSSSRATVVELPPAAEDKGIVRLSSAVTAEDVIQPVLEIERGKTVLLKPAYTVKRIAVGDPEIVDFVVNSMSEIQLIARAVGNTNVLIWDSGNRLQASIDIHVGAVRAQLVRELQRVLGRNDVAVDMAGESVVLRGNVPDVQTSEAAAAVAKAFFAGSEGVGEDGSEARVINLLSVGGNQQVMIQVVIAEMSRSVRRAFGTNLTAIFGKGGETASVTSLVRNLSSLNALNASGIGTGSSAGMGGMGGGISQMLNFTNDIKLVATLINRDSLNLSVFLEALEASQLGKILAEPSLVARSGELASFLAGGEIPIPVPQGDGGNDITIQFKRFGVQLEFIPTVLSESRIHLQVTPEVSQPDFTIGTSVAGTTVPAFRSRRAGTGVELGDGQSFAIGGLLQESVATDYEQLPFIGNVPILGQLFRSQRFQRDETELVIIVTPRLVQPLGPGPIVLPTDSYVAPTPLQFYLRGRIEAPARAKPPAPAAAPSGSGEGTPGGLLGQYGHRLRMPQSAEGGV